MRLALKFTLAFLLGMCAVLMLYGYSVSRREIGMFEQDVKHDDALLAQVLAMAIRDEWLDQGEASALDFLEQVDRQERQNQVTVRWFWVEDSAGHAAEQSLPKDMVALLKKGQPAYWVDPQAGDLGSRFTAIPVNIPARGIGTIQVGESLDMERRYTRRTIQNIAIATAALAGISALLAMILGFRFVGRPVDRLIQRARAVAAGDLEQRLSFQQHDELGELANELNSMCDQLAVARQRVAAETAARIATIEQLRHADRLKTVGQLASGIAHELGTPLNVIRARAKMVVSRGIADAESASNAQIIVEQSDRVTTIIRQLMDFARPRTPRRLRSDLRLVAERTTTLLTSIAAKKQVRLQVISNDRPVVAEVDPDQLQQVLSNLILNGIQAMTAGGILEVQLGMEVAEPPADHGGPAEEYVRIDVRDTGVGIPPENFPRLFEPFFTTKQVGEGTGLGLSVSRGIIREHGGWISVSSQVGEGSCFSIYLPQGGRDAGQSADRR